MIEDLKKLLPRERLASEMLGWGDKEVVRDIRNEIKGANKMLAEVHASLPSLVEYIYTDLREKVDEYTPDLCENSQEFKNFVLELLTPNK
jgi:hypothetical protein